MTKRPLIYLASPYTHHDIRVTHERARHAIEATAELMAAGLLIYSPIAHTHAMANRLPSQWEFWEGPSLEMLQRCDILLVLMLDGFSQSIGVQAEIRHAHEHYMPIVYWERELFSAEQLAKAITTPRAAT